MLCRKLDATAVAGVLASDWLLAVMPVQAPFTAAFSPLPVLNSKLARRTNRLGVASRIARLLLLPLVGVVTVQTPLMAFDDCNANGQEDAREIARGQTPDCNGNGIPDECDVFPTHFRTAPDIPLEPMLFVDLVAADLDQDGHVDIALLGSRGGGRISMFRNDGSGSFSDWQEHLVSSSSPAAMISTDINGDGRLDLVVTEVFCPAEGCRFRVLLNEGSGAFSQHPYTFSRGRPGLTAVALAAGDFDGDGNADLAVLMSLPSEEAERSAVIVLLNAGEGQFSGEFEYDVGPRGTAAVVAADLDGDGALDLAISNRSSEQIILLMNDGLGGFHDSRGIDVGPLLGPLTAVDVDADGQMDLVATGGFDGGVYVLRNMGAGQFAPPERYAGGIGHARDLQAHDVNNDGYPDLVVITRPYDNLAVLLNNGGGRFHRRRQFKSTVQPHLLAVADFDGDGGADVAVVTSRRIDQEALSIAFSSPPISRDVNSDDVPDECGLEGILHLAPSQGGNTGEVTVRITGGAFLEGTMVTLSRPGEPTIIADEVVVSDDGSSMLATVSLREAALGPWDFNIIDHTGGTRTLAGGFTVEAGSDLCLWTEIAGRQTIRAGVPATYTILYGNCGNVDAKVVPLWIEGIPRNAEWSLLTEVLPPPALEGDITLPEDFDHIPIHIESADQIKIPLLISRIPPGHVDQVTISLSVPEPGDHVLSSRVEKPWLMSPLASEWVGCIGSLISVAFDVAGFIVPGADCTRALILRFGSHAGSVAGYVSVRDTRSGIFSLVHAFVTVKTNMLAAGLECAIDFTPVLSQIQKLDRMKKLAAGVTLAFDAMGTLQSCAGVGEYLMQRIIGVLASIDPNEKVGPEGVGSGRYIDGTRPLTYVVYFENLESATLPAQTVVITDQLDAAGLDLDSLRLVRITIADQAVLPVDTGDAFFGIVDPGPDSDLLVRVTAELDQDTRILTWLFETLDRSTGQPTDDPLAGFLPPNRNHPEGEGSVMFTIMARPNLPTGTQIRNSASIVFDANAPIITNEWVNTIDRTPPVSQVQALPPQQPPGFLVRWSGTDEGSGIASYTVYVSENGEPFIPWIEDTVETSATHHGQVGHTYSFYSQARDQVGHMEDQKTLGEAMTTVVEEPLADASSLPRCGGLCGAGLLPAGVVSLLGLLIVSRTRRRIFPGGCSPS